MYVALIIGHSDFTDQLAQLLHVLGGGRVHRADSAAAAEALWQRGLLSDLVLLDLNRLPGAMDQLLDSVAAHAPRCSMIGFGQHPDLGTDLAQGMIESDLSLGGITSALLRAVTRQGHGPQVFPFAFVLPLLMLNRASVGLGCRLGADWAGDVELREGIITAARCALPPCQGEEAVTELLALDRTELEITPQTRIPGGRAIAITLQDLFGNALPWSTDQDLEESLPTTCILLNPDVPDLSVEARRLLEFNMANVKETLELALQIEGAMGAALVDIQSGMSLGIAGGNGIDMEIAAAGNAELVKAKLKTMEMLGIKDNIEDILMTLTKQYHLICLSGTKLFIYLVLNRQHANLAMARHKLVELEDNLQV